MNWALVTGAGKRLGRAVALDLARAGWSVAAHYNRSREDADQLVAEIRALGVGAVAVQGDLANPAAPDAIIAAAQQEAEGAITALVNCAAAFAHDTIDTLGPEKLQSHMALNTLAPALLARAFAASLAVGARGAVVNFLDFKLASPYPDHFSYTLSKYALAGATELLARALAPRVRVNAVAPGYVLAAPGQSEEAYARIHPDTPLGYGPTPENVANAVRFLIENPAVTGQTIYVDAGRRFRSYDRDMEFM
jgi:NAD(P)-dependent dehydrogenase (short-subunit alcohol dehydrogenase family)